MSHAMEGIALSGPPKHPKIRVKGKPAAYARPSVDLGGTAPLRREWRLVPAVALSVGDIVPGLGKLHTVELSSDYEVDVIAGEDHWHTFRGGEPVFAFTAVAG
jgi:hypothetical protein